MGSTETQKHVVSIQESSIEQSNSVSGWSDFFEFFCSGRMLTLLLSLVAVSLDPLFFYVPVVKNASTCLGVDNNLRIIVVFFRTFVDVLHTILWWHNSSSSVKRYRKRPENEKIYPPILTWTVIILAILPLPQIVIFAGSWQRLTLRWLKFIVLIQFVIRLSRIIPAYKDATRSTNKLLIYTWIAAFVNLLMYTIVSNILGSFWYLRAVERNMDCWRGACHRNENTTLCTGSSLYCDDTSSYKGYLHKHCSIPQANDTKPFNYGIYDEAFQTIITDTDIHFFDKFFRCLWWGLRNLSSLGQNLQTGTYIWDSFFAISIAVCGLVLFAFLIGNMQTYLQTGTPGKLERINYRRACLEGHCRFRLLPENLKKKITWCEDPKWQGITEINLESVLNNIPTEIRINLMPHLCKDMIQEIPEFKNLRTEQQDKLWELAKPRVFSQRSYIFREGDPIPELVFVVDGELLAYSKSSTVQTGVPQRQSKGFFCGEELLQQWGQQVVPDENFPIARKTVQAITKVEAFALSPEDLRNVSTIGEL